MRRLSSGIKYLLSLSILNYCHFLHKGSSSALCDRVKSNKRKRETLRAGCWRELREEVCAKNNLLVRRPRAWVEFLGYLKEKRLHTWVQLYYQTQGFSAFLGGRLPISLPPLWCNAHKCLVNSLSLRGSQRWKHLYLKPKNSNMVARITFSWNCVPKSCFLWCSISMCYCWLFVCFLKQDQFMEKETK